MAIVVEKTGKTVQEAVSLALAELNTEKDRVEIEIIEEGSKGIFGILGNKLARVRVTLRETAADVAKAFLLEIISKMKLDVDLDIQEEDDQILIKIQGKDSGIIIGRRGETLDSLQYLASLVVNKSSEDYKRITIDIENYRQKREETLIKLAERLADRVVKYRRSVTLEPMNPYERRIIHSSLQNNRSVKTYSVGDDPNRKVVIALK